MFDREFEASVDVKLKYNVGDRVLYHDYPYIVTDIRNNNRYRVESYWAFIDSKSNYAHILTSAEERELELNDYCMIENKR